MRLLQLTMEAYIKFSICADSVVRKSVIRIWRADRRSDTQVHLHL